MMYTKFDAILSLMPEAKITMVDEVITWHDKSQTPLDDGVINAELERLESEYQRLEYQRKRAAEYPPIEDYIDGVVKGDQTQVQAYIDACLAVKAKYPKE